MNPAELMLSLRAEIDTLACPSCGGELTVIHPLTADGEIVRLECPAPAPHPLGRVWDWRNITPRVGDAMRAAYGKKGTTDGNRVDIGAI